LEDDLTKYVEFSASIDENGHTTGWLNFNDEAKIIYQDVDGTGERPPDAPIAFSMIVEFDSLIVVGNRAVMSGTVKDSNYPSYVGKRLQLVVEDNGDDVARPDRLGWRLCQPEPGGWIPSDLEIPGDHGAYLSWWATDAEVQNDAGIPSKNRIPGGMKGCESFQLSAYDFPSVKNASGNIVVTPQNL
jgi:hypothetical protein